MLKGLLVSKFRAKYLTEQLPNLQLYIDNEVGKFLSAERLTEDNLLKLDDKIAREAELRDKKETILEDRRSSYGAVLLEPPKSSRVLSRDADVLSSTLSMPSIRRDVDGNKSDRVSLSASSKHSTPSQQGRNSRRVLSISSKHSVRDLHETFS